jgi:hypothetical protein
LELDLTAHTLVIERTGVGRAPAAGADADRATSTAAATARERRIGLTSL